MAKRYQGTTDVPLSPKGIRQARAIARVLEKESPRKIYTSTLQRACETARLVRDRIGGKISRDPRLNELYFGAWEGADYRRLARQNGSAFRMWREGKLRQAPGGESIQALARRVGSFFKELLRTPNRETVAVIAHGGPIKMLLFHALRLGARQSIPFPSIWSFRIDPASISLIEGDRNLLQIAWSNRMDHLPPTRRARNA